MSIPFHLAFRSIHLERYTNHLVQPRRLRDDRLQVILAARRRSRLILPPRCPTSQEPNLASHLVPRLSQQFHRGEDLSTGQGEWVVSGEGEVAEGVEGRGGRCPMGGGRAVEETADLNVGHGGYSEGGLLERVWKETVDS